MHRGTLYFSFFLYACLASDINILGNVLPLESSTQSIRLNNPSNSLWNQGSTISLQSSGNSRWITEKIRSSLSQPLRSGEWTEIEFQLPSTSQIGVHTLSLSVEDSQTERELHNEKISLEVTCDDGLFCNGVERFVNGECRRPSKGPCEDNFTCTVDTCDEERDLCSWDSSTCSTDCNSNGCIPQCDGLECGADGCGSLCGLCDKDYDCVFGVCELNAPGSCINPIPLLPSNFNFNSKFSINGDTTGADNEVTPTCNALSAANDLIYSFSIPQSVGKVGLEARSYSNSVRSLEEYDTVLEIRSNCFDSTSKLDCSDDATPPGFLGSRINVLLEPGTYFLIVDGFSNTQFGPYVLELNFHKNCMPLCEGAYCGSDLCGGSCGECASNEDCNEFGRCQADPCVPDCAGKSCGDDGCEGSCGTCRNGEFCFEDNFECRELNVCDSMLPECQGGCGTNEYCATDCTCRTFGLVGPDMYFESVVLTESYVEEMTITSTSCAVIERCIGGTGKRKLLKMTLNSVNQGFQDLVSPDPKTRPDLFEFSPCHGHFHFDQYATIKLMNKVPFLLYFYFFICFF